MDRNKTAVTDVSNASRGVWLDENRQREVEALIDQRDELLAALKGLLYGEGDGWGHHSKAERDAALAAIAKAEGSAK